MAMMDSTQGSDVRSTINDTDEPVDPVEAVHYWRNRWADSAVFSTRLVEAIHDIDAHARPLDEDGYGFVSGGYLISVGALHRALAITSTAPLCKECPHDAAHYTDRKDWR